VDLSGFLTPGIGVVDVAAVVWGQCYDHYFRRFLPIFGKKMVIFFFKQCFDPRYG
jgi:hypothetical protein